MHSNRSGNSNDARAGSGIETSSLRSSLGKSKQPGVTEPPLVLCSPAWLTPHQVSARFRPRTTTDSPALHPLHSSRSSPAFRRNSIGSMPGLRFFVPTAANWRDSQNGSCAPGKTRLQRPRGFATAKASAIIAGTVQLSRRSAGCACETGRPRWKDQIGLTLRRQAACRSAERGPCTHRVAARALRSVVEESDSLASR